MSDKIYKLEDIKKKVLLELLSEVGIETDLDIKNISTNLRIVTSENKKIKDVANKKIENLGMQIMEKDKQLKEKDEQLKEKDEQMKKLIMDGLNLMEKFSDLQNAQLLNGCYANKKQRISE